MSISLRAWNCTGLKPRTTYYYRLIAVNDHGQARRRGNVRLAHDAAEPRRACSPTTAPGSWSRPPNKDGSAIEPLREEGGLIQASEDGNAITYVANGPIVAEPEGNRAPYPTQALATRSAVGLVLAADRHPAQQGRGLHPRRSARVPLLLAGSLLGPRAARQPGAGRTASNSRRCRRKRAKKRCTCATRTPGSYLPLVTSANDTAAPQFGRELEFLDATPDLSHVVFSSEVPLTVGGEAGLYEWQAGQPLEPVSVLPDGAPALEPALGANSHNVRGAISSDGSRVFFTGESEVDNNGSGETVRHLYMRDLQSGKTIQLDAAVAPIPEPGEEESEVGFQAASSDGTKVFFTDTARLTEDSNLEPVPGSTTTRRTCTSAKSSARTANPSCKLSDLTVDQNGGESAAVLDIVPAVSEDGSYVYFVANGVLAPGASPGTACA